MFQSCSKRPVQLKLIAKQLLLLFLIGYYCFSTKDCIHVSSNYLSGEAQVLVLYVQLFFPIRTRI
jgi:hypothetical protein